MLSEAELNNFYRMLRAEGARETIELALQIARSNSVNLRPSLYDELIEICRDIAHPDLPRLSELKASGSFLDKIEFVNAARALNFSYARQLVLLKQYRHFNEIYSIQCWSVDLQYWPEDLNHYPLLHKLNLGNNRIAATPNYTGEWEHLSQLNLFANRFAQFPTSLYQFPALKELQLGANQISIIPSDIDQFKQLEYLGLTDNKIRQLPDTLYQMKQLKVLSLSGNPLPKAEIEQLKAALPNCEVYA